MQHDIGRPSSRFALRMWLATASLSILAAAGWAQTPAAPAFEVASIKPSEIATRTTIGHSGNHFAATGASLEYLITWAYGVHSGRLFGKPKWLDTVRYDVVANAPEEPLTIEIKPGGPGQYQQMMQTLLAERFKLALHAEARELPMYTLVVAQGGPRFQLAPAPEAMAQNPFRMPARGRLIGTQVSTEMLASVLSNQVGCTVRNETGLEGVFDFKLIWTPDTEPGASPAADLAAGPSIFTALQEQLGLMLQPAKGKGEVLVIDHIERAPTDN